MSIRRVMVSKVLSAIAPVRHHARSPTAKRLGQTCSPDFEAGAVRSVFCAHAFDPHRHDTYAIGRTVAGVHRFNYRGESKLCLPGETMIVHPDESHDGCAGSEAGFRYRGVYVPPFLVQQIVKGKPLPFFKAGVTRDSRLAAAADVLLDALGDELDSLAEDDALYTFVTTLAELAGQPPGRTAHHFAAAARAREYIDDNLDRPITLDDLADCAGRDRWSLSNDFRVFFGTSPHRYLTLRRLDRVKALTKRGWRCRMPRSRRVFSIKATCRGTSRRPSVFRLHAGVTPRKCSTTDPKRCTAEIRAHLDFAAAPCPIDPSSHSTRTFAMPDITLTTLQGLKQRGEKIVMLTCYDATFAHAASSAGVEMLLVGDTLGMVLHGHDSTLPVEVEDVAYHTACVKRGNAGAFIVGDMPFMSYATLEQALQSAGCLMKAGAHMVKLEGDIWLADTVRRLTENGVPVCVHLGLTPQSVNVLGGFKVQGRDPVRARQLVEAALRLEEAGAAMLLVECLPSPLAEQTQPGRAHPGDRHWRRGGNRRPGVGPSRHAGPVTDRPHARNSCAISWPGKTALQSALEAYVAAVKSGDFPAQEHGYLGVKRSRQQSSTGPFLASPSPALGQLPLRPNEVAGVAVGIAFQVVLVFRLGFPERAGGNDLGDDLVGPEAGCVGVGHGVLGHLLLLIVEIEDVPSGSSSRYRCPGGSSSSGRGSGRKIPGSGDS